MAKTKGESSAKSSPAKAAKTAAKTKNGGSIEAKEGAIMEFLYDMHQINKLPIQEKQVLANSGYTRTDSTGYRKIMNKLTKDVCYVERSKGEVSLTDAGIKIMQSKCGSGSGKPRTNKTIEEFYKNMILKTQKGAPSAKLDIVWELLSDRQSHSIQEILQATGYTRTDSTGYKRIMKGLRDCELVEKDGKKVKFDAEKVFPFDD